MRAPSKTSELESPVAGGTQGIHKFESYLAGFFPYFEEREEPWNARAVTTLPSTKGQLQHRQAQSVSWWTLIADCSSWVGGVIQAVPEESGAFPPMAKA